MSWGQVLKGEPWNSAWSSDFQYDRMHEVRFVSVLYFLMLSVTQDRLCGLVVKFLAIDPEVPCSIPGASRFSERQRVWNGVHSASWGQLRSYLEEIVAAPVKKTETTTGGGSVALTAQHPLSAKVGTTSATSGGRSVGIVCSRTKATDFSLV
jgi:hypothetical protein